MNRSRALFFLLFLLSVLAYPQIPSVSSKRVPLPGTTLSVALASDWEIGPRRSSLGINPNGLRYTGTPAFEITAGEFTSNSRIPGMNQPMMIAGTNLLGDCNMIFATFSLLKDAHQETISVLQPRPAFLSGDYYSQVLAPKPLEKRMMLTVCLNRGNAVNTLFIVPAPEEKDGGKLTAMLQSIADAAKEKSSLLYAPTSVDLPIIGIKMSLRQGVWEVGTGTDSPMGGTKLDVLNRTSGPIGLRFSPVIFPATCGQLMSAMRTKGSTIVEKPEYAGAGWFPQSAEMKDSARAVMMISACLQLQPNSALSAIVLYSANGVAKGDATAIAELLDATAAGVRAKMKSSPLH